METKERLIEESLDPQDWESVRKLGHRMIDDLMDYLASVRERPVWHPPAEEVRAKFKAPLPEAPEGLQAAYDDFVKYILPNPLGNIHPRFWGWVIGTGTAGGMLAELLAAGMNCNVWGADQVPVYVEQQVLDWCKQMVGFDSNAGGILVSGGSVANFLALAVARNTKSDFDVAKEGMQGSRRKLTFYGSTEIHASLTKAVQLLGLGSDNLRLIPINPRFEIDTNALEKAIQKDKEEGNLPVCIIGNAGTVNTGAIDNLQHLADLAEAQNLWLHVDGSFGAFVSLSPNLRALVNGLQRADSLTLCLHKWMYVQYEASCVLFKDASSQRKTFSPSGAYLSRTSGGLSAGEISFNELGIQLSRGFRALKIWMTLKEHGVQKFGRLIEQNVRQAQYLADLVRRTPELELLAPVSLNVVCYRFRGKNLREEQLQPLNQEILSLLHNRGIAAPSSTRIDRKFAIRVAITNHRSKLEDFDALVESTIKIGSEILRRKP